MRTIGILTVARSDYGILTPLIERIHNHPDLDLALFVTGMHMAEAYGHTIDDIRADGFPITEAVDILENSDTPRGIAATMGRATGAFADVFERTRPDILVVLGDRFEMHAACAAAIPFLIPVGHIAGGAVTLGAIDDVFRHSVTKISHLHFAETAEHARRIIQMGEEPWRVSVTGSMAIDNLARVQAMTFGELQRELHLPGDEPPLLVTYHPVTREYADTPRQMQNLLDALDELDMPVVFTYPNADTNTRVIIDRIAGYVAGHDTAVAFANLGTRRYFNLMRHARAMVGNSSSGIMESPSFELPVVNIGTRQDGRSCAANVIHCGYEKDDILAAVRRAVSREFGDTLAGLQSPFGDGQATGRIVEILETTPLDDRLLRKRFYRPE